MSAKVAIIIVTYNGSKYIYHCLASVFANRYQGELEVIVVDNASTDDSADLVSDNFPQVDLIRLNENLGFAGGNNIGIKRALEHGCDYIVLLNQDTEVASDWLENLVLAGRENKEAGIIQSLLILASERDLLNNLGNASHFLGFGFVRHYRDSAGKYRNLPAFFMDGYASGAAMLIKREVLESVAAFDEKFFAYMEDLDLCWRARLSGYKIMLAPRSVVYHHYQFNKDKQNFFYWNERNRWAVLLQNYSLKTLLILSPALIMIELAMLVYSLTQGWIWQKLKSYSWVCRNLSAIRRQRRAVQAKRIVSDKEIIKMTDWRLTMPERENLILKFIISPILYLYYKILCMLI